MGLRREDLGTVALCLSRNQDPTDPGYISLARKAALADNTSAAYWSALGTAVEYGIDKALPGEMPHDRGYISRLFSLDGSTLAQAQQHAREFISRIYIEDISQDILEMGLEEVFTGLRLKVQSTVELKFNNHLDLGPYDPHTDLGTRIDKIGSAFSYALWGPPRAKKEAIRLIHATLPEVLRLTGDRKGKKPFTLIMQAPLGNGTVSYSVPLTRRMYA